jgi:hypothetical protein
MFFPLRNVLNRIIMRDILKNRFAEATADALFYGKNR